MEYIEKRFTIQQYFAKMGYFYKLQIFLSISLFLLILGMFQKIWAFRMQNNKIIIANG